MFAGEGRGREAKPWKPWLNADGAQGIANGNDAESIRIECLPFDTFIKRYDSKETLFYLDSPYPGGEGIYGKKPVDRPQATNLITKLGDT